MRQVLQRTLKIDKMKKTTTILIVLFLILGSVAAWYITTNSGKPKASYHTSSMDFKIDPDLVHKVFLADREGHKTTLIRKDGEWLLEGVYKTRPNAISYLLEAIKNVEVKYRPAKAAYPSITKDLATYGIEVELYGKEGELLKNYYVGGVDEKGEGSYMIMAESDEPFATHLKMFVGSLRTRFSMTGDDWRDRSIFNEEPEDVISISVEYPKQKNKSFIMKKDGSQYTVEPLFNTTPIITKKVMKGKPEQYLQGFKSKLAESFQNEYTMKDFAKTVVPFAIVSLTLKDGTEKTVRFIPFQKVGKNGELIKQDASKPVFRYHADCSWGDFMLVQQGVFKEVFWQYEGFF